MPNIQYFSWDAHQNLREENENSYHEKVLSREEKESQEEPTKDSRGDQNKNTMRPETTQTIK